jgi:hypothetical protein
VPEVCFDGHIAAAQPFGFYESVDEAALFGSGGAVARVVVGGEGFVVRGAFAVDQLGFGVEAGFESVLR